MARGCHRIREPRGGARERADTRAAAARGAASTAPGTSGSRCTRRSVYNYGLVLPRIRSFLHANQILTTHLSSSHSPKTTIAGGNHTVYLTNCFLAD